MTAKIEIWYFTDPYCSWCWATEPPLFRLREVFRDHLQIRYIMGGLVRDMADFFDAHNNIRTTAQVAPHWREVSERSGQPIDERLMEDITDAHWSTWPAGIAVKAAEQQGAEVGERYLRRLRRAALTERENVSAREVQLRLAKDVIGLDMMRLATDLNRDETAKAFAADLNLAREFGVSGFPTLLFRSPSSASTPEDDEGILVGGHRSYQTYLQVLNKISPGLALAEPRPVLQLLAIYGPLTTRELSEIQQKGAEEIRREMETLVDSGKVGERKARGGEFWELAPQQ